MTAWNEISRQVMGRLSKVGSSIKRQLRKIKIENNKPKHKIYPEELIAIIASIVLIMMAYGGLGLTLNVLS